MKRSAASYRKGVNHGLEPKVDLLRADDLGHILAGISIIQRLLWAPILQIHTLGSFGSRRATLMPSSLKNPFAWAR